MSTAHSEISYQDLLWKSEIDSIEGYDQVFGVIHLLKCTNDTEFATDRPSKVLMGHSILKTHALLVNPWQVVFVHSREIVSSEPEVALFQSAYA